MKKLLLFLLGFALLAGSATAQQVDPGFAHYRNTALTSTAIAIKAGSTNLYGFNLVNVNTVPVYVKFYNGTTGTVTVGTTAPVAIIEVPAGNGTTPGCSVLAPGTISYLFVNSGLVIASVTGLADNSTAAPSTAIYCEALYK